MRAVSNDRGSVLVFVTLMITLLLIMVGMGLDTGQLTYVRSQGQAAVDAAALVAASGLPVSAAEVANRVGLYNSTNDHVENTNTISGSNITYVNYNQSTTPPTLTALGSIAGANGVRVALEQKNPYTGAASNTGLTTPVFLTPLLRLMGLSAPATADVSVSAVAVVTAVPSLPIAMYQDSCGINGATVSVKLLQSNTTNDNSCWTTYLDSSTSSSDVRNLFEATQTCSGLPANAGVVGIGSSIHLNNGQQTADYKSAEKLFIPPTDPPKCWMIPVVPAGSSCNRWDTIVDWAKICVTDVVKDGSDKYIQADVTCGQSLVTTTDSLCFTPRLVREPSAGM